MRRSDQGNAVVEFVAIVVAVMVPLALVGGACWQLVANQLALYSAVHGASRAYVLSDTTTTAATRVKAVVRATVLAHGIPPGSVNISVRCSVPSCLEPGEYVTVTASRTVTVVVPLLGRHTVAMSASDTGVVDVSR